MTRPPRRRFRPDHRGIVPQTRRQPRADTVGSLLRGDAVVRAARRASPADGALLNDAARDAIMLQEEIGLDVITDGEVRRVSWAQTPRFVDAFAMSAETDAERAPGPGRRPNRRR